MLATVLGLVGGLFKAVAAFFGWRSQRDLVDAGRAEERAERDESELRIAKRQGEIMAQERTDRDVEKSLGDGSF